MSAQVKVLDDLEQGTQEWLDMRKKHITATDAATILGVNPWKTRDQLYNEKLSNDPPMRQNEAMKRGSELEPVARELFNQKSGYNMIPKVLVKDWMMASLDGISDSNEILEIKCPGEKTHALALSGKVPEYYYPQMQHQMAVAGSSVAYYFSFDGWDGVSIKVLRDDEYIQKMIDKEYEFYQCLKNKTPPEPLESEYTQRSDTEWLHCAEKYKALLFAIKSLEKQESEIKKQLIFLSGGVSSKGAGLSIGQVTRKGLVDYSKIPQLSGVDLESYRKPSSTSWRVNVA